MKKLIYVSERIEEELEDAEEYIEKAAECKGIDDTISSTAREIAMQEVKHAEMWHEVAVEEIEKKKAELKERGEEVHPAMREIWEHKHRQYVDQMAHIRHMLDVLSK